MYADAWRDEPVSVSLDVPGEWKSYSGMEREGEHQFSAANWDVLVDSPIETGINKHYEFTQDNRDYEVVFWGRVTTTLKKRSKTYKSWWLPVIRFGAVTHLSVMFS